jgi:hypothetical protein
MRVSPHAARGLASLVAVAALGLSCVIGVVTSRNAAAQAPVATWYMRNGDGFNRPQSGPPDSVFAFGSAGDQFVAGAWNGLQNGWYIDSPGVFENGWWYLAGGPVVNYGAPWDKAVVGDWNGDGTDTIGVFENGWWYLRNSNTPGPPDVVIHFGSAWDTPVAGRWGIGVFENGWWYLRNSLTGGSPDVAMHYGSAWDIPVVGYWGPHYGGTLGIGVYENGWWYIRNTLTDGPPDWSVNYGGPGDTPVVMVSVGTYPLYQPTSTQIGVVTS